jgi:uncharacterized membrane protein
MRSLLLGLVVAFIPACLGGASSTGITQAEITCDTSLTYANFGQAFMQTNCGDCHSGKHSPNLSTQSGVKSSSSKILDAAVYSTSMPQGTDLTNEERTMLGQWLSCGAP